MMTDQPTTEATLPRQCLQHVEPCECAQPEIVSDQPTTVAGQILATNADWLAPQVIAIEREAKRDALAEVRAEIVKAGLAASLDVIDRLRGS